MARKSGKDRGLLERPKGSNIWYARVVYQGRQYCKRAASKSHAREVYYEMRTAIRKGAFPPEPGRRPALIEELLEGLPRGQTAPGQGHHAHLSVTAVCSNASAAGAPIQSRRPTSRRGKPT